MAKRGRISKTMGGVAAAVLNAVLPTAWLEEATVRSLIRRARRLPADESLRLLFRVDDRLYHEQGNQSVRYGNGIHSKHRHMAYHDFFVDRIGSTERVLDVGCGVGAVAHAVAKRSGAYVVGVDYNSKHIQRASRERAHPRVEFRCADVLKSPPPGSFDVAILSNVLEHIPQRVEFLRELVAAAGLERLLIRVPLFERDWRVPLKRELGVEWRLDDDHKIEHTLDQFREEVSAAGLSLTHIEVRWGEIWAEAMPQAANRAEAA